jgi:nucleotide-binding universal stress UspA family protein
MYTRILVPLDGSSVAEQGLPYVRFLSGRLKAPVELLGVIDGVGIASSVDAHKAHYVGKLVDDSRRASEAYLGSRRFAVAQNLVSD